MKAEIKIITPKVAQEMLERNPNNRHIRKVNLDKLVAAMNNGMWRLNGETMKVAPDGRILDGQHRLMAAVLTDTTFESWVIYDVPPEVVPTMNTGASRTVADFHAFHGEENATRLAAAVNAICAFKETNRVWATFEEQALFLDKNPILREIVGHRIWRSVRGVSPAMEHASRYVIGFHFGMEVAADWFGNFAKANYDDAQRKLALWLAKRRGRNKHLDSTIVCAHVCQAAKMSFTGKPKAFGWAWNEDAFPLELEEIYL
jgi:hypothetical protein